MDFYCAKAKLALELDGSQHYDPEAQGYDKIRTRFLESLGILVVRYANTDIDKSFEGVCIDIDKNVKARLKEQPPPSADGAPFVREGGKAKKSL